jgi:hypothetical protein
VPPLSPQRRWTPRRIRNALLCPKPEGAIGTAYAWKDGRWPNRNRITDKERAALQHIVEHADLLSTSTTPGTGWLLVEAPLWVLEALCRFEAEREDDEPDDAMEDDGCGERDADDEHQLDAGDEPELDADFENDAAPELWGRP